MGGVGPVNLDGLLKLRLVVARVGEMDLARWWNTQGQLGPLGTSVVKRGFPRTHRLAQARAVFAVASHRCSETYDPAGAATLWRLPAEIEDAFQQRWRTWLNDVDQWADFFTQLEKCSAELSGELLRLGLIEERHLGRLAMLPRSAENRAVQLPGAFEPSDEGVTMLALAFARGETGSLAVPYHARPRD